MNLFLLLQTPPPQFFPTNLKDWAELIVIVVLWLFSLYRTKIQVDGFGDRMKAYEKANSELVGEVKLIEKHISEARLDREHLHERVGEYKAEVDACGESINEVAEDIREAMEASGRAMERQIHELEAQFRELKREFETIERLRREGRLKHE